MTAKPSTHERLISDETVKHASDRTFGLVFATVFAIIGLWPLIAGDVVRLWALGVAAVFLLLAGLLPKALTPLNRRWTRLGLFLHRIASFAVLALLFYLVITPMGLAIRILGRDLLKLRFEPEARSYWIARIPPGPAPDSIKHQF